jgi:hypothetical protein
VIARDRKIFAQDDAPGIVDTGALAADEDPVYQRDSDGLRTAGVKDHLSKRLALGHRRTRQTFMRSEAGLRHPKSFECPGQHE